MDFIDILIRALLDWIGDAFHSWADIVITATPEWAVTPLLFMVGFAFMGMMFGFMHKHRQDVENGN